MPCSELLSALFDQLSAENVPYVVLRNYEGLPESVRHDVDLLLDEADLTRYCVLLQRVVDSRGWQIVRVERRYGFYKCYLYRPGPYFLQVDAFCPQHYCGVPLLLARDVFDARQHLAEFYVPSPGHEAVDLLFKELLGSGRVKRAYVARVLTLLHTEPDRFEQAVSRMLGSALAFDVKRMCEEQDWDGLESQADRLRRALLWRAWRSQPWDQSLRFVRFILGHASDYLQPSGFFVCLIGPDGSGKTTVAEKLSEALDWTLFQSVFYFHSHFAVLPQLKVVRQAVLRLLGCLAEPGRNGSQSNVPDVPHSPLRAIGYLVYYTLDYILGHILVLRARSKGRLVLCDRYFYDYMIQWMMRLLPEWLPRMLSRIVPQPDMVIFLENEAETVYQRKQDISVHEIQRQMSVCRRLVGDLASARAVWTAGSVADTVYRVIDLMMKHMAWRVSRRRRN